jgi:Domain of unknown function (DUF4402)
MKKTLTLLTAIVAISGFFATTKAQTVTTFVGAKIVEAITLTETSPMHFGTMTVPTTPATVTINATLGTTSSTGTITLLGTQAPFASTAAYTVSGSAGATYAITLPAATIIGSGIPADNMVVDNFISSVGLTSTINFATPSTDFFNVGATLNLAANQPAGLYNGTFDVSVAYN